MKKSPIFFTALMLSMALGAQYFDYEYHDQNFFGLATDTLSSVEVTVSVASDLSQTTVLPFAHLLPADTQEQTTAVAPRKDASAADACPVDSVKGYDEQGNMSSLTLYTYDSYGRTVETATWLLSEGVKKGVSKTETQYDDNGRVLYNATWEWDDTTNDWKG